MSYYQTHFYLDVYTKLVRDSPQPDSVLAKLTKFNCSVSNELLVTYSVANVKTERIPTKCILDDNKLYICLSDVEEYLTHFYFSVFKNFCILQLT